MLFRTILNCTFVLATAMPLCAFAGSLQVNIGAWEMTATTLIAGVKLPPEVQAQMSSSQRARLEEVMQAHMGKPLTHVSKTCVTKEDLDQDRLLKSDDEEHCTRKIISKTASQLVLELTCTAQAPSRSTVTIDAKTPESMTGSMDMVQASGGKVHIDIDGRWLGASCDGIDKSEGASLHIPDK